MVGFVLIHVPPDVGESVVVEPIQIGLLPVISTIGLPTTVSEEVAPDMQPVDACVKINVAVPAEIP